MKRAVIYYSLSENTKVVAEKVAAACDADLYRVEKVKPLPEAFSKQIMIGGMQSSFGIKPKVTGLPEDISAYDEIKKLIDERKSLSENITVGDIGSGGGCPGIPLAIAFPDTQFVLVERMEKRCDFLENAIRQMNLKNAKVFCTQADKVPAESFDIITKDFLHKK